MCWLVVYVLCRLCYKTMMSRSLRVSASQTPTEPLPAASWADQDETAAELPALPSAFRRVCLPDAPDGISSCPNTLGAPCSERDTESSAPCTAPLVPPAPCGGKTNYPLTRVDSYRPDHFTAFVEVAAVSRYGTTGFQVTRYRYRFVVSMGAGVFGRNAG